MFELCSEALGHGRMSSLKEVGGSLWPALACGRLFEDSSKTFIGHKLFKIECREVRYPPAPGILLQFVLPDIILLLHFTSFRLRLKELGADQLQRRGHVRNGKPARFQ